MKVSVVSTPSELGLSTSTYRALRCAQSRGLAEQSAAEDTAHPNQSVRTDDQHHKNQE